MNLHHLCKQTIRNRLISVGLHARNPAKKAYVSAKNRQERITFAKEHIGWTTQQWSTVLWSDESKFNLFGSDGRCKVWRPNREKYNPLYQKPTVKHGGGNVLIWGAFSRSGTGPLIQITGIMDRFVYRDILEKAMLPYARVRMPRKWTFQQDNDPKHSSKVLQEWLVKNKVDVLKWPSQSPDLNPIEHLWNEMGRRLGAQHFSNSNQLYEKLREIWSEIPVSVCERLLDSMPRRCQAVLDARGYPTKY